MTESQEAPHTRRRPRSPNSSADSPRVKNPRIDHLGSDASLSESSSDGATRVYSGSNGKDLPRSPLVDCSDAPNVNDLTREARSALREVEGLRAKAANAEVCQQPKQELSGSSSGAMELNEEVPLRPDEAKGSEAGAAKAEDFQPRQQELSGSSSGILPSEMSGKLSRILALQEDNANLKKYLDFALEMHRKAAGKFRIA